MSLSSGALTLAQDIPERVVFPESNYTSTSDAVLNRRHLEIAPLNETTYTPSASSEIIIDIASNTSFLDLENSYIRFDLTTTNDQTDYLEASLERGGVHSLFSHAELRVASTGTIIERLDMYNVFCAMEGALGYSPDDGERLFAVEADGNDVQQLYGNKGLQSYTDAPLGAITTAALGAATVAAATADVYSYLEVGDQIIMDGAEVLTGSSFGYTDSTATIAGTGSAFLSEVTPGDLIYIETLAVNHVVRVVTRASDTAMTVEGLSGDITDGTITHISRLRGTGTSIVEVTAITSNSAFTVAPSVPIGIHPDYIILKRRRADSMRHVAGKGVTSMQVTMKPRLGFFRQKKLFPLFLLSRGLQLVLRLESQVDRVFVSNRGWYRENSAESTWTVSIANVRYCAIMYDLHSSVNQEYINLYQNGRGVLIPFKGYVSHSKSLSTAAGAVVVDMNIGVRSATHVMSRVLGDYIYNGGANSTSAASPHTTRKVNRSLSLFPLSGLYDYQYSSGSLLFPPREVVVGSASWAGYPMDMIRHQQIMMKQWRDRYNASGQDSSSYAASNSLFSADAINGNTTAYVVQDTTTTNDYSTPIADSDCGILCAVLGRDPEGNFSGLDLSVQPLRLDLNFGAALGATTGANRLVQSFVAYDAYMHISEATGVAKLS
jgi:hypothetical protein